jgi:alpha-tubulin suppressor-like RCC1 family protein
MEDYTMADSRGSSFRWLHRPIALAVLAIAWGCGEDETAPTAVEPSEALASATAALSFSQVSAGALHTCGIATNQRAYCWGDNSAGELGNGTTTSSNKPVLVAGGLQFVQISAGTEYTCGITTSSFAYCWGSNDNYQLGIGNDGAKLTPTPVAAGRRFSNVRAGFDHTCAVTPFDVGFCWGKNRFGEVGANSTQPSFQTPVRVAGGLQFLRVVAGGHHSCGVTTGNLAYCWGNNDGALGDGTFTGRRKPVPVLGGLKFRLVVAGGGGYLDIQLDIPEDGHTCGVTTDNRGYCWGQDGDGELGAGNIGPTFRTTPIAVSGNRSWRQVIAGWVHTCGVTTANVAFCWGNNQYGQNGDGTTTRSLVPVRVAGSLAFTAVTTGPGPEDLFSSESPAGSHSCGLTTANRVYCWGSNELGQLGDGSNTRRLTPVAVVGP